MDVCIHTYAYYVHYIYYIIYACNLYMSINNTYILIYMFCMCEYLNTYTYAHINMYITCVSTFCMCIIYI